MPQETAATGRPEPPLPDAPRSRVAVALEIKLDAVRELIEAALPVRQEQDWTLVTREGASPRIELRVVVERDAVALVWKDGRLRTEVQLRYWAAVRGAVKSPLPWQRDHWFNLAGDQSWGTRKEPQRTSAGGEDRSDARRAGRTARAERGQADRAGPAARGLVLCRRRHSHLRRQGDVRRRGAERVQAAD